MQIVIDINDEIYKEILNGKDGWYSYVHGLIKVGIPLPKGHGRLIDADRVIKKMEEREERLKDNMSIWETAGVETAINMFGETIIGSDRLESEG